MKLEARGWRLEAGDWRLEDGGLTGGIAGGMRMNATGLFVVVQVVVVHSAAAGWTVLAWAFLDCARNIITFEQLLVVGIVALWQ